MARTRIMNLADYDEKRALDEYYARLEQKAEDYIRLDAAIQREAKHVMEVWASNDRMDISVEDLYRTVNIYNAILEYWHPRYRQHYFDHWELENMRVFAYTAQRMIDSRNL